MLYKLKTVVFIVFCLTGCTADPLDTSNSSVNNIPAVSSVSSSQVQQSSSVAISSSSAMSVASSVSSAPPRPTSIVIDEDSTSTCAIDGITESVHAGFSGAAYANSENTVGKGITWHVVTEREGSYNLAVSYASGSVNARDGQLVINGIVQKTLALPSTNEWTNWQSATTNVQLAYGSNIIQLLATTAEGLSNIDTLSIAGTGLTAGNCAVANIDWTTRVNTTKSTVAFTAAPYPKGESSIAGYDWDFGDGANTSGKNASHAYTNAGDYTVRLTVTDRQGNQSVSSRSINIIQSIGPATVYIAGDSTVSTYTDTSSPADQAGWGQMLHEHFNNQVTIHNRAIGGRSSRRFIDDGALDKIWKDIKAGDYFLVQFGTNDGNKTATYTLDSGEVVPYYLDPATDYKFYLKKYIDGAKSRNANLIFVTPPPRNSAYCNGGNGIADWAQAMRELALEHNVPVVDVNAKTVQYLKVDLCPAPTPETIFFIRADGSIDGTHFQENGARVLSQFVADGILEAGIPLATHLKN